MGEAARASLWELTEAVNCRIRPWAPEDSQPLSAAPSVNAFKRTRFLFSSPAHGKYRDDDQGRAITRPKAPPTETVCASDVDVAC